MPRAVSNKLTDAVIRRVGRPAKIMEIRDHIVTGLLIRIHPTAAGNVTRNWKLIEKTADGKRRPVTLGSFPALDCASARKAARELRGEIVTGEADHVSKDNDPTLGQFIDQWEKTMSATGRMKSASKAAKALRTAFPMDLKVRAITRPMVLTWQAEHAERTSPTNSNRLITGLAGLLNHAVELEIIDQNPARLGNGGGIRKLPENPDESRFFSAEEWAAFDAALNDAPQWFADACRIALNVGCRLGELFELPWHHVDLTGRKVTFAAGTTKTGKARTVPLNATATRVLTERRDATGGSGLVFEGCDRRTITRHFNAVLEAAAIEKVDERGRGLSFRSLRTTFGSWGYLKTRNLVAVSKLLGHSSIAVTAAHYSSLLDDNLTAVVAALEQ